MEKPDVDAIEGLSPAISIEQKSAGHNPRSTVGTITEVYDYLRLLWARVGIPHCPQCGLSLPELEPRQSSFNSTCVSCSHRSLHHPHQTPRVRHTFPPLAHAP